MFTSKHGLVISNMVVVEVNSWKFSVCQKKWHGGRQLPFISIESTRQSLSYICLSGKTPRQLKLYKTREMLYKEEERKIQNPSIVKQEILSLILLVLLTDAETDLSNAPIDTFLPSYQIFLPPPLTYGWLSEVIEVRINISRPKCRPFHLALICLN